MAVIDISQGWMDNLVPNMFRLVNGPANPTSNMPAYAGLLSNCYQYSGRAWGRLFLMKGTVPTDFSTLVNLNARITDILVTFSSGSNAPGDFITAQVNVNPAVISTQYVNAVASGTATWFWWVAEYTGNGNGDPTQPLLQQIIGTVGLTGSGADLEMVSNVIVTGEQYRVLNIRIQFPSTWTY